MDSDWSNVVDLRSFPLTKEVGEAPYRGDFARPPAASFAKKLGFNVRTIPPGQYSCPYHFHHDEEEIFYIVEGEATLRQGNRFRTVRAGEVVFFPTGAEGAHQFFNHSDRDCRLFAVSNRSANDVVEFPDSGKIFIASLKKLLRGATETEYLEGERDPSIHWPAPPAELP